MRRTRKYAQMARGTCRSLKAQVLDTYDEPREKDGRAGAYPTRMAQAKPIISMTTVEGV